MKSILAAIVLTVATSQALALGSYGTDAGFNDVLSFEYLSWCEGNKVMAATQKGVPYQKFNCEDQGKVCKTYDVSAFYPGSRQVYAAACEAK